LTLVSSGNPANTNGLNGSGVLTLTGTNTYTGNTTVSNGTLVIQVASLAGSSTVSVATGAVLQLDFTTTNVVAGFLTNGVSLPAGVYNAANVAPFIAGLGSLQVASAGPSVPATLTNSFSGTTLSLSWPAEGWKLQQQTNALSKGLFTNWVDITDGSASSTNITVDRTQPTVFYRLVYP
jgi:autotransporter-associated beta strand protein